MTNLYLYNLLDNSKLDKTVYVTEVTYFCSTTRLGMTSNSSELQYDISDKYLSFCNT